MIKIAAKEKGVSGMKTWKSPEMKVFSVKMNENIAASGDDSGSGYEVKYIYYDLGGITRGGADYRCTSDGIIQDTNITYTTGERQNTVSGDKVTAISGCLA